MVRSASSRISNHEARANSSFETALTRLLTMRSVPSKLPGDRGQHFQQRGAVGRSQQFVEARFVLGGDELFGARQHCPALVGQNQDVRAAIVARTYPLAQ